MTEATVAPGRLKWTPPHNLWDMSDEQRRARPAAQYGPTAAAVAENVLRLRKRRDLSIYQLSALLREAGRPITPAAVGKIERQQRQVTVDDLAALAVVFGVSPTALLLPLTSRADDRVEITGGGSVDALRAWEWGIGRLPLKTTAEHEKTELLEHRLYGMPQWLLDHVRYSVIGGAAKGQPTAEGQAMMQNLKDRYREETGQELDPNDLLRLMFGASMEGGGDGPRMD